MLHYTYTNYVTRSIFVSKVSEARFFMMVNRQVLEAAAPPCYNLIVFPHWASTQLTSQEVKFIDFLATLT